MTTKKTKTSTNSPIPQTVKTNPDYSRIRSSLSPEVAAADNGLAGQLERGARERLRF